MVLTQESSEENRQSSLETFPRLKTPTLKRDALKDVDVVQYYGSEKPNMPLNEAKRSVLPLKVLAHQSVIKERSRIIDLNFLYEITSDEPTPEFSGFNTCLA